MFLSNSTFLTSLKLEQAACTNSTNHTKPLAPQTSIVSESMQNLTCKVRQSKVEHTNMHVRATRTHRSTLGKGRFPHEAHRRSNDNNNNNQPAGSWLRSREEEVLLLLPLGLLVYAAGTASSSAEEDEEASVTKAQRRHWESPLLLLLALHLITFSPLSFFTSCD